MVCLLVSSIINFSFEKKFSKVRKAKIAKKHKSLPRGFHTIPIYGATQLMYYYINIYIGNPPQKQSVILDTESDFLSLPCSKCKNGDCGKHNNPILDIEKDKTARLVKCFEKIDGYVCNQCTNGYCSFLRNFVEKSSLFGYVYEDYIRIKEPQYDQVLENIKDP